MPLLSRDAFVRDRLDAVPARPREARRRLLDIWLEGVAAPRSEERVWIHGDLHSRNVLVLDGVISGIIDWGDMTAGDAATDLAAAWMVLETPSDRARFWDSYPASNALRARARAWAVFFGAALSASGEERHEPIGHTIVARLLAESDDAGRVMA